MANKVSEVVSVPTIKELRQKGFSVDVMHERFVRVKQRAFKGLGIEPQFATAIGPKLHKNGVTEVWPRGGRTVVVLLDSNDNEFVGEATCSPKDNYCKKEGIRVALQRALQHYRSYVDFVNGQEVK